jgi:hypothetical protein
MTKINAADSEVGGDYSSGMDDDSDSESDESSENPLYCGYGVSKVGVDLLSFRAPPQTSYIQFGSNSSSSEQHSLSESDSESCSESSSIAGRGNETHKTLYIQMEYYENNTLRLGPSIIQILCILIKLTAEMSLMQE